MDVIPHASVEEFFHKAVLDALERAQVKATTATECYLVSLLGTFATSKITDEPLSLKLVRTSDDPAARLQALKEVGDTSLYLTGFFRPSLQGKLVDPEYYIDLGGAAYRELSQRLHGPSAIGEMYSELSAKFPRFAEVLNEVSKQVDFTGGDLVKLYQQWLTTRSEWVERRLRSLGIIVGTESEYLQ